MIKPEVISNANIINLTDEDKQKLTIKDDMSYLKYTLSSFEEKGKMKHGLFKLAYLVLSIIIVIACYKLNNMYIVAGAVVGLLVLWTVINKILKNRNKKILDMSFVDIKVMKKLPVEDAKSEDPKAKESTLKFYPIIGKDTTSGYETTFYLTEKEYNEVSVEEKIRIMITDKFRNYTDITQYRPKIQIR